MEEKNVLTVFRVLVSPSGTMGFRGGKFKKHKNLSPTHVVKLFDLIVTNWLDEYTPNHQETNKIFYPLLSFKKDFRKIQRMGFGIPEGFKIEFENQFNVKFSDFTEEQIEQFLDTGERLYTYLTATLRVSVEPNKHRENWETEQKKSRELVTLLGLSLSVLEERIAREKEFWKKKEEEWKNKK